MLVLTSPALIFFLADLEFVDQRNIIELSAHVFRGIQVDNLKGRGLSIESSCTSFEDNTL